MPRSQRSRATTSAQGATADRSADKQHPAPGSILIVRLGALGDIVHALPALAALRSTWPAARIDWLVDAKHREILDLVDGLDGIVPITPGRLGGPRGLRRAIARLRAARYDVCFDLQGLLKSALLARASGASRVVGFPRRSLREPAASLFYTETAGRDEGHVIDKNVSLLEAVGLSAPSPQPPVASPQSPAPSAQRPAPSAELVRAFPLRAVSSPVPDVTRRLAGAHDGFILLNPGGGWPNKRWPAERFAELARRLATARGLASVVVWGPREESLAATVARLSDGAARMAPLTALADLVALARDARLMVSGDTGPLHVAAAVGTPLVGLYGPTDPGRNGPWHPRDITLSRYGTCQCHFKRRCTNRQWCLAEIAVGEVEAAVAKRLGPLPSSHRAT